MPPASWCLSRIDRGKRWSKSVKPLPNPGEGWPALPQREHRKPDRESGVVACLQHPSCRLRRDPAVVSVSRCVASTPQRGAAVQRSRTEPIAKTKIAGSGKESSSNLQQLRPPNGLANCDSKAGRSVTGQRRTYGSPKGAAQIGVSRAKASVCNGKRGSQGKGRKFNGLRDLRGSHGQTAFVRAYMVRPCYITTYERCRRWVGGRVRTWVGGRVRTRIHGKQQRQGCALLHTDTPWLGRGDAVYAHIGTQSLGNQDGAVGLLVVLEDRNPSAADGQARAI